MKRAFIPEEKTDSNPTHINKSSSSLDNDRSLSPVSEDQSTKLRGLKSQTLARNKTINVVILILGNIAVILLLLFIYYSL